VLSAEGGTAPHVEAGGPFDEVVEIGGHSIRIIVDVLPVSRLTRLLMRYPSPPVPLGVRRVARAPGVGPAVRAGLAARLGSPIAGRRVRWGLQLPKGVGAIQQDGWRADEATLPRFIFVSNSCKGNSGISLTSALRPS
jgi:hypothetical protein